MKKTLLVIAISTVLTACGSGGSGGSNSNNKVVDTKKDTQTTNPIVNNDTTKKDTTLKGVVLKDISKADINKFELNGKTIMLMPNGFNVARFLTNSGGSFNGDTLTKSVSGTKYAETRFGILAPDNADVIGFSQGKVTAVKDMPTKNAVVKYLGDFVVYENKEFETGTVDIDVNFGLKNIKIDAFADGSDKVIKTAKGTISGNQFTVDSGKGKGQFYGSKAAELSGVYKDGDIVASFGAKKQ
ncbi:transferrin-binding protein-like solute binding protein [Pasteurella atlantica]|uniref:transferrin-binding protein-like solute binding protein n=1 Tax=Pasteurellaceae TaxID=712 RepID=UPI00274B3BFE|nr:transferrin-binding protein-like solute binding protein [Pasteurella atlantica]MDP8099134.1 transferrin-binding protein-like solute binding protein [Pasteurella atlantica]MDP8107160.1 transferrin-binding protein-like solute binding protein [Pasteurella atlantica]MDP8116851.1 transferrin-binding protein-like solute binding protein [Pasteurella atlantica]